MSVESAKEWLGKHLLQFDRVEGACVLSLCLERVFSLTEQYTCQLWYYYNISQRDEIEQFKLQCAKDHSIL